MAPPEQKIMECGGGAQNAPNRAGILYLGREFRAERIPPSRDKVNFTLFLNTLSALALFA